MREKFDKTLLTEEAIRRKVIELARQISDDYTGKTPILICVLKGSFIFLADLVREISVTHEVDFMVVSSYGKNTTSSGSVRIIADLSQPIENRDILLVEDIYDTGLTLTYIKDTLLLRKPASLKICALLYKKKEREFTIPIDYIGFEIEDRFIVGYGLDFREQFRNLPYIACMESRCATQDRNV